MKQARRRIRPAVDRFFTPGCLAAVSGWTVCCLSLDISQRISPNLLGQITINTDFAETEVDTRRSNLTRFPLLFPEKRTFFLEGADLFDFGLGLGKDLLPFHSRRIGLVSGSPVPLRAGARVSGRLNGTSVGALVVRTGGVGGVAPNADMGVVRVRQNLLAESSVGIMATVGDPQGRSGSWLSGADLTYQTSSFRGDKNFIVGLWGMVTDREDLSGDRSAVGLKIDYPNDLWDIAFTWKRIGESFDPSLGFVPRPATHQYYLSATFSPRPDWKLVRQMIHQHRLTVVTDLAGQWESWRFFWAPVNWQLGTNTRLRWIYHPFGELFLVWNNNVSDPFDRWEMQGYQLKYAWWF